MFRLDSRTLFDAFDAERKKRNMIWKQVAIKIGVSESTITRTRKGGRMEVNEMLAIVSWLGVPVETFTRK